MPYIFKHRRPPEAWEHFRAKVKHPALLPFFATEYGFEWAVYFLSRWSFLEVLEYLGTFSILIAVIFYFAEAGERKRNSHYQAWQVINTARGQHGSGGRIEAIESLNEDDVPLVGIDVESAYLQNIRLEHANLQRGFLMQCDLRGAQLAHTNMQLADVHDANLRGADLSHANLKDASLNNTDLTEADVRGANLENVDLRSADISGLKNWDSTTVHGMQIDGIENPPAGFVDWALSHGAVKNANAK